MNNVEELLDLTNQNLSNCAVMPSLRAGEERRDVLLPAIERFVGALGQSQVSSNVNCHGKIEVNDRLAAEIFQMVTGKLSNVRRHALCNEASVDLTCKRARSFCRSKTGDLS
jgi:signal transduction histidine kinase